MFTTTPEYELPIPKLFRPFGDRYWRAVEVPFNAPWFLATFETPESEGLMQSLCLSDVRDLQMMISDLAPYGGLQGLCYMVPPWQSPDERWEGLPIRKVWRASASSSGGVRELVFEDWRGRVFGPGWRWDDPLPLADLELITEVLPPTARDAGDAQLA